MPQDNTLGAPTEGLGQTVTFASQGGRGVPQTSSSQRNALRTGLQGGGARLTAQALQIPDQGGGGFLKALGKIGEDVVRPLLEQERTAAYVQGMQKAAQGEAITEIVDEQPWYTKLFGSTSLVDGARAYTASAKAASVAADMEAAMPELRKMSPAEFNSYATKQLTGHQTGDSATDMMFTQQVASTLPQVMKGQAKAHLRFQQEQLESSMQSAQTAAFAMLGTVDAESRKPGATRESADVLGAAIGVVSQFDKPAGMQQDLHDKLLSESAVKAISGGNFAAYKVLKDSGKLETMDPQAAYQVERMYQQASSHAKLNVPDELLQKVADLQGLAYKPGTTDEDILTLAKTINSEYTQMTGDPGSFLGKATTLTEMRQLRDFRDRQAAQERRAIAAATSKAEAEKAKIMFTANTAARVVGGDGNQPYVMHTEAASEQQDVFDHIRATATPAVQMAAAVSQYRVATDKVMKSQNESAIAQALQAGDPNMLYRVYTERYLPLVKAGGDLGTAVAEEYAGQYGDKMAKYHSLANGQAVPPDLQGAFYNDVVLAPKPLKSSPRSTEIVKELTTGRIMSLFTQPVRDPEGYAALLEPRMKSWLSVPDGVADARKNSPDVSLVGGYHWPRSMRDTELTKWVLSNRTEGGVAADNIDKAFASTVSRQAAAAGIDGNASLGQTTDTADGTPQLFVRGIGSDGQLKIKLFKASEINADWKAGYGHLDKTDLQFGPKLTNLPPDEQPSIYASPAEWEAYRKKQAAKPKKE